MLGFCMLPRGLQGLQRSNVPVTSSREFRDGKLWKLVLVGEGDAVPGWLVVYGHGGQVAVGLLGSRRDNGYLGNGGELRYGSRDLG